MTDDTLWTDHEAPPLQHETMAPTLTTWADLLDQMPPVSWLWPGWLPRGFVTLCAAESGTGKSALLLRLAMTLGLGAPWPDGTFPSAEDRGKTLWLECESAQALNFDRARRWENGALLPCLISPWSDPFADTRLDNPDHLERIYELAAHPEIQLIVVDALRGAHSGDENDSGVGEVIRNLARLAQTLNKTILISHHLNKRRAGDNTIVTLDRLRGSSAIGQYPRTILALDEPDGNHRELKRLSVIKSNLAAFPEPLGVQIGEDGVSFLAEAPRPPQAASKVSEAEDFLRDRLTDSGLLPASTLIEQAESLGISQRSLERARSNMGVKASKSGAAWYWSFVKSYCQEEC